MNEQESRVPEPPIPATLPSHPEPGPGEWQGNLNRDTSTVVEGEFSWKTTPKPPEPKKKPTNKLGMVIGIPLVIAVFGFIIFLIVVTAFRFAGTVGDALGLPPAVVTIGAILLAIFVIGYFFNQLG